jgi:hypothetical protein
MVAFILIFDLHRLTGMASLGTELAGTMTILYRENRSAR